jgi:two-component system, NtrC family, sensor kinase
MVEFGTLAFRLAEASDIPTAAERLAEHVLDLLPSAAARIYLFGPGDRCGTCPRARSCAAREQCLHLSGGLGEFAQPTGHAQRVPRTDPAWAEALAGLGSTFPETPPPELEAPPESASGTAALLVPLEAGGEILGVLGVRAVLPFPSELEARVRTAGYLTAAAIRTLRSRQAEHKRFEQLMLVNDLGRKVNAILNDDLLLRQATVDIHRTFGFHNVMIFMLDERRQRLELKAQAARYAAPAASNTSISLGEGIIGRVCRTGRTEVVEDVSRDKDFVDWFADTRSEIAVPIQIGGVVEGVLNVESDRTNAFGPSERLVLETVSNQLAIALENARLFGMVKEREDRYRTLVESSPAVVFHLDAEGRIIYANPAVTELTGYEKAHVLSRMRSLVELAAEPDREKVAEAVAGALRGVPCRDVEFQVMHAGGGVRWASASLQPLVGDHGDAQGVVVLARDRTRERELQEKLMQSEKLSAIGSLVSGVAHELNNPLAGILGYAQLLLGRPVEQWARGDIEKVERNARRCQRIVENLLTFARQSRMTKRRANLNEVVESVIALNEYQFQMDNVRVERDFDPRVPAFPVDVNRWQQVFVNLASNAHQALVNAKSKERVIRFQTRLKGRDLVIRVSDTGPGIPEHLRSRVFEPFFTTKENGTGLGLGICFGIVRDHGGVIELEAGHESGAHFRMVVPVVDDESAPAASARPAGAVGEEGEGRHVLVVDDDPYVCDVVVRALQNHKYTVRVARDGMEALREARRGGFDVLLTDVRMPGELDGIGLYDTLSTERPDVAARMVFMTGNLLDSRTMDRLEKMKVRCVEKPFDIHHLASVVNEVADMEGPPANGTPAPDDSSAPSG